VLSGEAGLTSALQASVQDEGTEGSE